MLFSGHVSKGGQTFPQPRSLPLGRFSRVLWAFNFALWDEIMRLLLVAKAEWGLWSQS